MTAQELHQKITRQQEEVAALKSLWQSLFPEFDVPADRQFIVWINRHPLEVVAEGLSAILPWYQRSLALAGLPELPDSPGHVMNEDGEPVALRYNMEELQAPSFRDQICRYASACMKRKAGESDGAA